jgi:hypothetical protein
MQDSDDVYPRPLSDPEADGLPETADDSTADAEVFSSRAADGNDPAPLPPDREDGPDGLEEYGTGGGEGLRGEALWRRLRREEPDVSADSVAIDPDARLAEEADPDQLDQLGDDSLNLAEDGWVRADLGDETSVYDRSIPGIPGRSRVGRLVQPDDGGFEDVDADEYAYDAGPAGGASAEEDAVHIIRPDTASGEDEPDDDTRDDASV